MISGRFAAEKASIQIAMPNIPHHVDDIDWPLWQFTEHAVLCFIVDGDRILLIHKKTGLGAGKVNGPGGRIEPGESPLQAAVRETEEERREALEFDP